MNWGVKRFTASRDGPIDVSDIICESSASWSQDPALFSAPWVHRFWGHGSTREVVAAGGGR